MYGIYIYTQCMYICMYDIIYVHVHFVSTCLDVVDSAIDSTLLSMALLRDNIWLIIVLRVAFLW